MGADDRDTGWGDGASRPVAGSSSAGGDAERGPVSAEDEQYLRDRPPHWG